MLSKQKEIFLDYFVELVKVKFGGKVIQFTIYY